MPTFVGDVYIGVRAIQGEAIDMEATLQGIKQYVLNPDHRGSHLRQLAEYMGRQAWENDTGRPRRQPKKCPSRLKRMPISLVLIWLSRT